MKPTSSDSEWKIGQGHHLNSWIQLCLRHTSWTSQLQEAVNSSYYLTWSKLGFYHLPLNRMKWAPCRSSININSLDFPQSDHFPLTSLTYQLTTCQLCQSSHPYFLSTPYMSHLVQPREQAYAIPPIWLPNFAFLKGFTFIFLLIYFFVDV